MDLIKLCDIAIKAALDAGTIIQKYMDEEVSVEIKKAGTSEASQVVTKVDKECEEVILSHLDSSIKKYDLAMLTEEQQDDGSRFEKEYFWCIDPMDGTLAFVNKRSGFSVSIALVSKDGIPMIGVVFDPMKDDLYHAIKGGGAFKNRTAWTIENTNRQLSYVTDRRLDDTPRADEIRKMLNENLEKLKLTSTSELSGGGAVMNAIYVLENGPALMCKFPKNENGGGSVWDFAATACIYQELGLPATNFSGAKLDLNRRDSTFMNHEGIFYRNLSTE